MRILSVNIGEFGGLRDTYIEFSESLNLIKGDNESGKSTILLFIIYMLYGLPKSSRRGTPNAHDKDRSLSVGGKRAEGSMEIESGGIVYRIQRANLRRTASSEAVITELDTGMRINVGEEPGKVFLGVDRETFESCLWCGQTRASTIDGGKVTQTLSNLSLTADESVDGVAVLERIREARKFYKHERGEGGAISEISKRISEERERLFDGERSLRESFERRAEYETLAEKKIAAEDRLRVSEENKRAVDSLKLLSRFEVLRGFRSRIEKERVELDECHARFGFVEAPPSADELVEIRTLWRKYELQKKAAEEITDEKTESVDTVAVSVAEKISARGGLESFLAEVKKHGDGAKLKKILAAVCVVAALVFAAVGFAFSVLWILSAFCAVSGALLFALSKKQEKELEAEISLLGCAGKDIESYVKYCFDAKARYTSQKEERAAAKIKKDIAQNELFATEKEINAELSRYGRAGGDIDTETPKLIADITEYLAERKRLENTLSLDMERAEYEAGELEEYNEAELLELLPKGMDRYTQIDEASADRECAAARDECKKTEERLTNLKIQIASSGIDEDALSDIRKTIAELEEKRREYTERYEILNRAFAAVEEASLNMRRNFAPRIRERAGELLGKVSDGKYSKLFLSEELEVSVEASGREMGAGYLSTGTADAVYIALRFALIEHIFECGVPFFMDETLSSLDDKRASRILKLIEEFTGHGNQCLLFTCHTREGALCDALEIKKNEIFLGVKDNER